MRFFECAMFKFVPTKKRHITPVRDGVRNFQFHSKPNHFSVCKSKFSLAFWDCHYVSMILVAEHSFSAFILFFGIVPILLIFMTFGCCSNFQQGKLLYQKLLLIDRRNERHTHSYRQYIYPSDVFRTVYN